MADNNTHNENNQNTNSNQNTANNNLQSTEAPDILGRQDYIQEVSSFVTDSFDPKKIKKK